MRRTATVLAMVFCLAAPGVFAKEDRATALKKCRDEYNQTMKPAEDSYLAAMKDAETKKGKERTADIAAAKKARTDSQMKAKGEEKKCIDKAPKT